MTTKTEPKRQQDAELLAMSRITRVLGELDVSQRRRVLDWLNARHQNVKPLDDGNGDIPFDGKR